MTELNATFPTSLEVNYFVTQQNGIVVSRVNIPPQCGSLITQLPEYIQRLRHILDSDLRRYTDLPIQDRLYVEDIDSFQKVRDVNPAMVRHLLTNGYLALSEDKVQTCLEQILEVPFHRKDWGGEINDLYTANVVVNGARRATAFLLKGPGIGSKVMEIADCGKRGDQIVRLFDTPADLFVVQYVGPIGDLLIKDVQGKVANLRAGGEGSKLLDHGRTGHGASSSRLWQAVRRGRWLCPGRKCTSVRKPPARMRGSLVMIGQEAENQRSALGGNVHPYERCAQSLRLHCVDPCLIMHDTARCFGRASRFPEMTISAG